MRVAGYLKARKVILAFGMQDIEIRLVNYSTGSQLPSVWQVSAARRQETSR
jgi:hypothetical protein